MAEDGAPLPRHRTGSVDPDRARPGAVSGNARRGRRFCLLIFPFYSPKMERRGGSTMALTKRQKQVLDFIAGFLDQNDYCPSYEEIAGGLDLASLATVHKHISVLETK